MPAKIIQSVTEDAIDAADALASSPQAMQDALRNAQKTLSEAAKTVEKAVRDGVETLRAQAKTYTDNPSEHVDKAQQYVVERVKERPMTATLAGLGLGLVIGLLIANRDK